MLGFANYHFRHLSTIQSKSKKSEELWNIWFTVNHVTERTSNMVKDILAN